MPEYVDKEKAIDLFYSIDPENDGSDGCTTVLASDDYTSEEIEEMLSLLPVADVAPVVHGRWKGWITPAFYGPDDFGDPIYRDAIFYRCSICGRKSAIKENFCPNCGAKLDLEDD